MNCTRIYDPIHGFISITPLMKQFINTIEFQRLRDLKQLGATTFVFPSANHTRFEHSIGVSHLAGLMIENLKKNGLETITERDVELCRLAGLLHDIGHGPFSHLYDDYVKQPNEPDHEERGCTIIRNMVKTYEIPLEDSEVEDILNMIHPSEEHKFIWKYQIVANKINQLDVDKLDYIQRDCFYLGMKCAGEYSRIIKDATVFNIDDSKSVIAWPNKLQYEIFQLFATRYRLHKQVYNHPNVKACEFIIIEMLKIIKTNSIALKNFGDSIIYCKYVDYLRKKLFERKHIKYVGELTFVNDNICPTSWGKYINYMKKYKIFHQKLSIGFGGNKNPLKNIKYFKDGKIILYDPSTFSFMIPTTYKEVLIRIYCKNMDNYDTIKMHYNKMLNIYNGQSEF